MMRTIYAFRFGSLFIEYKGDVLLKLQCIPKKLEITSEYMQNRNSISDDIFRQVQEFITGKRTEFDVKYELQGTDFQKKVWFALKEIPYGQTCSYGELAKKIGSPKASRAVGMANNKNPLHLIIPCHRVIGANGSLTGYAGGIEMKKYLLETEKHLLT